MKKSALIALIGVCILLADNLFYNIIFWIMDYPWEATWYEPVGQVWRVLTLIAWVCVGQFFFTLYNKAK